jgi:hypothetical protein
MILDSKVSEHGNCATFIRPDENWARSSQSRRQLGNGRRWTSDHDPVLSLQFGYGEVRMSKGISQSRLFKSCMNHTRKYSQSREARQWIAAAQIPIFRAKKLKKTDYVPESKIDALKDHYNTWHIYFSKIYTRNIAKTAE